MQVYLYLEYSMFYNIMNSIFQRRARDTYAHRWALCWQPHCKQLIDDMKYGRNEYKYVTPVENDGMIPSCLLCNS
jgi:hypothetical protein